VASVGTLCLAAIAPVQAQSNDELLRRIDALQRRIEELEASQAAASRVTTTPPASTAGTARASRRQSPAPTAPTTAPPVSAAAPPPAAPRVTRAEIDEALRGELPNSIRVPGTETSVRLYGFIKANLIGTLDVRDRGDAPSVQGIPLSGSAADQQGGDLTFTARRSRIGFDTQSPTALGPLATKLEFDFAGDQPSASGAATSSGYMPRLRQAYVEVGGQDLRVLVGQANSLWNEGLIETLTDSTFLNASAVRQAQIRVSGGLAPGLTGQVSLEAPYTDFTSSAGVLFPDSTLDGGASPAMNQVPDLLGRLTWRGDFGEASVRGLLRQLRIDTSGTAAFPNGSDSTIGWGFAAHANLNLGDAWKGFGQDQLIGMAYYGQGIGRYFDSATNGQAAYSDIGLTPTARSAGLEAVPSWGFLAGYRHFWAPTLRSTAAYAYTRLDNPAAVASFAPGSAAALAANRDLQMGVVNLIWSPFARESSGRVSTGWLDVGLEYIFYRRDLEGGATSAGPGQLGHGIEQRIQAAMIARF
jgi:hypothetical protein